MAKNIAKNNSNPKIDAVLKAAKMWRKEMERLRKIALGCKLTEELKWGWPCYSLEKKNIVLIHGFKDYCALLFFKGALLKDPGNILVQQTENVQAARQIRFANFREIVGMEAALKDYIHQAIAVEKSGLKVNLKKPAEFAVAEEFKHKLAENPKLKMAFEALTPGRQRAYLLHFSAPKQSATRAARVEKYAPKILAGKGLNDD